MLKEIVAKLKSAGDKKTAESSKRFFKEDVNFFGLKSAQTRGIAKEYMPSIAKMDKSAVFELAQQLMKLNYLESSSVASDFVYAKRRDFTKSDFKVFEKWANEYITNWAACDTFFNHCMNALIEKFPELIPDIKKWCKSRNRWVRRAAAVTFILSARHGKFIDDVFEIADTMLTDEDDMVQKGYGWALKAAGESAPTRVYDFVTARHARMPRTAYRYAIEKLPADMRKKAMSL